MQIAEPSSPMPPAVGDDGTWTADVRTSYAGGLRRVKSIVLIWILGLPVLVDARAGPCYGRVVRVCGDVVSNLGHRERCADSGGSDPDAVCKERGVVRSAGFACNVRWPGYVGRDYCRGGVLWISNIHRNFDSAGLPASFARDADECIRGWRDGLVDDSPFLDSIRAVYERGLGCWLVGAWPGKALAALEVASESVAYTNVAKCQAVDTGVRLQELCMKQWPLRQIVEILEPGLVLLTSATGLEHSGPASWPCDVLGFSQRNGRLLKRSPWKPPGVVGPVPFECWIDELVAARRPNPDPQS